MLLNTIRHAATRCNVRCHSNKARNFAHELRKVQVAEQAAINEIKKKKFEATFPEIKTYANDDNIRDFFIDCEDMTWPRGCEYKDRMRDPSPSVRKYIQSHILSLLESGVNDELVDFLKVYMTEKKLL